MGVVLVGADDVVGDDDVEGADDVDVEVDVWGPWKSSHDSLRTTVVPELTTRALELTV